MTSTIHVSKVGTYHPAPKDDVAWTVSDGPSCDGCGTCGCGSCPDCKEPTHRKCICQADVPYNTEECVGLSFTYIRLDGRESLCQACFDKAGDVDVVECDCRWGPTMRIRIADNGGKTADRYTVLIGRNYWHMSADADMPNGVCMYAGFTDGAWRTPGDRIVDKRALPHGTRRQIARVLRDIRHLP